MKFHLTSAVFFCLLTSVIFAQSSDVVGPVATDTVQWKTFSASLLQKTVYLQWQNAEGKNASFFIVEKSTDGINFSEIGRMQAGSSSPRIYSLTDVAPQKGAHFYRIKSVADDNNYTDSPVKKITAGERQAIMQLLQNPVIGNSMQVVILGQSGMPYTVRIYNAQAKLLMQKPAVYGSNSIDLSNLTAGLYLAVLLHNDQPAVERLWVVKQ